LRLARLSDVRLLEKVRRAAGQLLEADPDLAAPQHALLAERLAAFWSTRTGERS
jgi:hypothetical protein